MMKDQRTKHVTKKADVHAIMVLPEANVMNANQISLGKSVTHVMKPSLIIHLAKVGLKDLFFDF